MPTPPDHAARLRPLPRQLLLALASFGVLTVGGLAWDLHSDLQLDRSAFEHVLRAQSVALSEHAAVSMQEAAGELELLAERLELAGGPTALAERDVYDLIHARAGHFAQVGGILVTDAAGALVASSLQYPVRRISLADRDYFLFHRDDPSTRTFLGRPAKNRINGEWRFFLTRRLSGPGGRFAGVLGVALDLAYFESFYRSIEIARRARVALVRTDGVLLVLSPPGEPSPGDDISGWPLFATALRRAQGGLYRDPSAPLDGPDRTIAFQTVRGYPIVAAVSVRSADVLDAFWVDAAIKIAATAVMLAVIGTLAIMLARRLRELELSLAARGTLEREVFRASKVESLGVLAGGIAHDFNNLLAGILAGMEVARDELRPGSEGTAALADSRAAVRRATTLTRQLLAFSKGGVPVRETTSLPVLVRESARFVLHGSRSTLRLELAPGLRAADVDAGQISQVVQNLALNAAQAMPAGGAIEISARNLEVSGCEEGPGGALVPGRYVEITVSDDGDGIPPENLERVFDPFFTTKPEGHGLGLATVHAIVSRHGGAIRVTSTPGRGTRFTVILPAAAGEAAVERTERPGAAALRAGLRVLVVDDDEHVSRAGSRMLRMLGCDPESCADAGEAVERYREARDGGRRFDVVLTDVTLPGPTGGPEVAAAIRRLDSAARILMSSGYTDLPIAIDPARHGVDGYLAKPYTLEQLRAALALVLRDRAA